MRLLDFTDLKSKGVPYSAVHLRRMWRAKKFPQPVRLGENRIGFVESEVDAWIEARIAERDAANGEAA